MRLYMIRRNGRFIFGTGLIETAYEYLNEKLKGKVWLTTPNAHTNVLVSVVLSTGGLLELVTDE